MDEYKLMAACSVILSVVGFVMTVIVISGVYCVVTCGDIFCGGLNG